jgi:hypothetical protein
MEIAEQYALKFKQPALFKSERAEIPSNFLGHGIMLKDRKTKELRDATGHDIAILFGHVPTGDLHAFFKQCEGARSFSRVFWWAIKPKARLGSLKVCNVNARSDFLF